MEIITIDIEKDDAADLDLRESLYLKLINSENTIPRYEEMTVAQLKEILRERNLPVSGAKYLLIERLNEFDMIPDGIDDKVEENLIDIEDNDEWRMDIKDI